MPIAHNPDFLSDEQVGVSEGWRLLDEDEITSRIPDFSANKCDQWLSVSGWTDGGYGTLRDATYRTRLTRAELRKARGLSEPGPEPPINSWYLYAGMEQAVKERQAEDMDAVCATCGHRLGDHSNHNNCCPFHGHTGEYLETRFVAAAPSQGEQALASALAEIERMKADLAEWSKALVREANESERLRAIYTESERLHALTKGELAVLRRTCGDRPELYSQLLEAALETLRLAAENARLRERIAAALAIGGNVVSKALKEGGQP